MRWVERKRLKNILSLPLVELPLEPGRLFYYMSKAIIKDKTPFTLIPNDLVFSSDISLKAKGLYAYLQAKPDNWQFAAYRVAQECKEGKGVIESTLKELEKAGYLVRQKYQNEKGHWKIEYNINAIPNPENPQQENPTQENPVPENPVTGKSVNKERKILTKKESTNKEREKAPFQDKDLYKQQRPEHAKDKYAAGYNKDDLRPYAYMKQQKRLRYEQFYNEFGKHIQNPNDFLQSFNDKYDYEGKTYDADTIYYRLRSFARNWQKNEEKNKPQEKRSKFI